MKSTLKQYLSMEDTETLPVVVVDPTQAPVVPAEEPVAIEVSPVQDVTAEEAAEADACIVEHMQDITEEQAVVTEQSNVLESVQSELTSLETYVEVLKHGVDTKQFSPQFAAVVSTEMARYSDMLGLETEAPSLEALSHDNLEAYYTTSLEFFNKTAEKLLGIAETVRTKLARLAKTMGTDKGAIKSLNVKADAATKRVKEIKATGKVEVSLKGIGPRLGLGGKFPSDLPGAVSKDQKSIQYLTTTFFPATVKYGQDLRRAAESLTGKKKEEKDKILTAIVAVKHPYFSIPADIRNGTGLFSYKLAYEEPKVEVKVPKKGVPNFAKKDDKGGPSERDIIKSWTGLVALVVDLETFKATSADKTELTKTDVGKLITAVKQYASLYETLATAGAKHSVEVEKILKSPTPVFGDTAENLTTAAWSAAYGGPWLASNLSIHIRQVGIALTQLVDRALSALEKADKAADNEKKKD